MEDREYKYLRENHMSISKKELENMFNDKEKNKDKIIRSQFAMVLMLVSKFSHTTGHSTSNLISYALEGLY
jgi:DNA-directed RNA polymerase specialized sigma subunit